MEIIRGEVCSVLILALLCLAPPSTVINSVNASSINVTGPPHTLAYYLGTLMKAVNWAGSIYTCYIGYFFNKCTLQGLQTAIDLIPSGHWGSAALGAVNPWCAVLYWYVTCAKYGIENQTTIEWALDNATMLPNGLPQTRADQSSTPCFCVYDRYALQGFYYARKYNYDLAKWNLTKAYNSFVAATNNGTRVGLWFYGDDTLRNYSGRYYDEWGQTMDCFLQFYSMGVNSSIVQAQTVYYNDVITHWGSSSYGQYFGYMGSNGLFECEAGGFAQLVEKLGYYDPQANNLSLVNTDIETRFLSQEWNSPQWYDYVVVHARNNDGSLNNPQRRLENTAMAWSVIYGLFNNLTTSDQAKIADMLLGGNSSPYPAWYLLLNNDSDLYHYANNDFSMSSDSAEDDGTATSLGMALMAHQGIVPFTTPVATPLQENVYEDDVNLFDHDLLNLNLTTYTVTVGVPSSGILGFQFGSFLINYSFPSQGVYAVQFSSDWNNITGATRLSGVPSGRIYLGPVTEDRTARARVMVVRGMDDRIYYRVVTGDSWEDWNVLPGSTIDSPAVAMLGSELYVVVRGSDGNSLWYGYLTDPSNVTSFSGWTLLGGATSSAPALTSNGTVLCLVVRGLDDRIYYRYYRGSWGSWQAVPTGATPDAPAAAMLGSDLHIVVRGMDGSSLWHVIANDSGVVQDWESISGATDSKPSLIANQVAGELYLVVKGLDDGIWYRNYDNSPDSWGSWNALPGATIDGPGAMVYNNKLYIAVRGSDGNSLWCGDVDLGTGSFAGWILLSGATPSAPTLTS